MLSSDRVLKHPALFRLKQEQLAVPSLSTGNNPSPQRMQGGLSTGEDSIHSSENIQLDYNSSQGGFSPSGYASGPICSEYSLILLFSVLGGTLLISSSDLISMYLSIELQSFAVYILASLHKDNESSVASGLKYFLLGGLSSCFILLGAGLLYSYTGLTHIESIFSLILSSLPPIGEENGGTSLALWAGGLGTLGEESTTSIIPVLGLLFIVLGFLFKIAAAPLHN